MVLSLNAVQRENLGCEENTNGSPCFILSEPPQTLLSPVPPPKGGMIITVVTQRATSTCGFFQVACSLIWVREHF